MVSVCYNGTRISNPVKMNKIFNKRTVLLCGVFPSLSTKDLSFEQYKAARGLYIQDPWERVKSIFSKDAYGKRHPELIYAFQMTELGAIVGMFYGGITETVRKSEQFIYNNDTNIYSSKKEAYKVLANHSMLSFVQGGLRRAPAFALFMGGFSLVSSCCEAYRNKLEIVDSIVAGTVVGSLSRFMFGIKGMISGGVIGMGLRNTAVKHGDGKKGSILGTIYGTSVWLMLKISKTDQMELKYAQFAMSKYKREFLDKPKENEKTVGKLDSTWLKEKEKVSEEVKKGDESTPEI